MKLQKQRVAGVVLLVTGALLLAATGAYYAYGAIARSNLDELAYEAERPTPVSVESVSEPGGDGEVAPVSVVAPLSSDGLPKPCSARCAFVIEESPWDKTPGGDGVGTSAVQVSSAETVAEGRSRTTGRTEAAGTVGQADVQSTHRLGSTGHLGSDAALAVLGATQDPDDAPAAGEIRDADALTAFSTDQSPEAAGDDDQAVATAPADEPSAQAESSGTTSPTSVPRVSLVDSLLQLVFGEGANGEDPAAALTASRIDASKVEAALYSTPTLMAVNGDLGPATRIRVPAIGVDSELKELSVLQSADSSAWETPKHVVGHIPTTATPDQSGEGWYFGHLESPIKGEGSVFRRLPEIPDLAKSEPIYVFLEADGRKYVYQVYQTVVVHQDDLRLTDSGKQDITLVTCTPRFYYDHRLLVTAALVGVLSS